MAYGSLYRNSEAAASAEGGAQAGRERTGSQKGNPKTCIQKTGTDSKTDAKARSGRHPETAAKEHF